VSPRDSYSGRATLRGLGGFGGPGGPPPRDLLAILATLFVTFSLQFFSATQLVPALLRLTPLVWRTGFVWQLLTYPFIGYGGPSVWILLELLILFWFGRDVYAGLGRKHFWRLVLITAAVAGLVALGVDLLEGTAGAVGGAVSPPSYFPLLQGQRVLLAIFIAAFATANRSATILLFFVLPIEARWFLLLEILFAFIGYLQTHDGGGFVGICVAVGLSYLYVRDGGFGRGLRQTRLRAERWWLQKRLERSRRRSGLRVVKSPSNDPRGPWTH
jgi:membrane associated rhomboid family serine protease